jgi:glutamate synthase (NADPH) small chain
VSGCPVHIKIPDFIALIARGEFEAACLKIKETNNLPAICGRVCPQEQQCEKNCVLAKKKQPIAIGQLERFCADYSSKKTVPKKTITQPSGKKAAIIGSGPAGLTAAADLALLGHKVVVFEALHAPGGVLIYGIPEFRLPKQVVLEEIETLRELGVEIKLNTAVGQTFNGAALLQSGFDSVFIATGAGLPKFLNLSGEQLQGVYSSNEFLTRVNLMKAWKFPNYDTPVLKGKQVAVIGGGNVALDCARCALRLGARVVDLIYRRDLASMPARKEEIEHALEEGIFIREKTLPVKILGNAQGKIAGLKCLSTQLQASLNSSRPDFKEIPNSGHILAVDQLIVAIGQGPNPLLTGSWPELKTNSIGYIEVDQNLMSTSLPGVFAGGDIVTGAATVIAAMGAGKKAAQAMHAWMTRS